MVNLAVTLNKLLMARRVRSMPDPTKRRKLWDITLHTLPPYVGRLACAQARIVHRLSASSARANYAKKQHEYRTLGDSVELLQSVQS